MEPPAAHSYCFAQNAQDVVVIVEAVRLSSCKANWQALRLVVVQSPENNGAGQVGGPICPGTGAQGRRGVCGRQDSSAPGDLSTDTGIALANMTLAAWDNEVGSCIMGAINKPALTELLGIEEPLKLAYMVAFGYPTHKAHIVRLTADTGVKYYLTGAQAQRGRDRTERVSCMAETGLHIYIYFPHRSV